MATIKELIAAASDRLTGESTTPQLDTELLYAAAAGQSRTWVVTHATDPALPSVVKYFNESIARRVAGEPLAYITGQQEFFGRTFAVDSRVLIPRPETELLVEAAIALSPKRLLEIGTGSGCIAISLAATLPHSHVVATDVSQDALAVATANALTHGVTIDFRPGDLFNPILGSEQFDVIISNPPYVNFALVDEAAAESRSLQFEPRLALTPDHSDPLNIVRRIVEQCREHLTPAGTVLIEIGSDQGAATLACAAQTFPAADCHIRQDLAGRDRYLVIQT